MQIVQLSALSASQYHNVRTNYMTTSTGGALCSINAANCLIIVLHDPGKGNGCIAHIAPRIDETPVLQKMVAFLTSKGGTVATFEVLLAGAASREQTAGWHAGFLTALKHVSLNVANVHDCRVNVGGKTVIGQDAGSWRQVAFEPNTGQVAEIPLMQKVTEGMTKNTVEYEIDLANGQATPVEPAPSNANRCVII